MPKIIPRPLSPGELSNNARKLAEHLKKPVRKPISSAHPEGILLRSKDVWGNPASVVSDIRKEF